MGDYLIDIPNRGGEALSHFKEALRIQPNSADAHNAVGGYYLQTGREVEAKAEFEAALRTQPFNAEAHFNLALICEKDPADLPKALGHYEAAVKSKPQWQRAQKSLGLLLLKLGRNEEARLHLAAAQRIQYDPEIARVLSGI
jgi:Tfp pilus assembly protein PilF